jgi:histone H3/H4
MTDGWKRCSACKEPIPFAHSYFVCSVSTCTRKRTGFVFCSVDCWEAHLPMMRHREAWAVEETSPTAEAWARELAAGGDAAELEDRAAPAPSTPVQGGREREPVARRRIAVTAPAPEPAAPREILVVASRLKDYVRQRHGMNTSDAVLEVLSDALRRLCDAAAARAREDGRKTVMDRDFTAQTTPQRDG